MNHFSKIILYAGPLPYRMKEGVLQVCMPKVAKPLSEVRYRKLTPRRSFECIAEQIAEEDMGLKGEATIEADRIWLTQSNSEVIEYIIVIGIKVHPEDSSILPDRYAWMTLDEAKAIHKSGPAGYMLDSLYTKTLETLPPEEPLPFVGEPVGEL